MYTTLNDDEHIRDMALKSIDRSFQISLGIDKTMEMTRFKYVNQGPVGGGDDEKRRVENLVKVSL
jgi:hypothetical protein